MTDDPASRAFAVAWLGFWLAAIPAAVGYVHVKLRRAR